MRCVVPITTRWHASGYSITATRDIWCADMAGPVSFVALPHPYLKGPA